MNGGEGQQLLNELKETAKLEDEGGRMEDEGYIAY